MKLSPIVVIRMNKVNKRIGMLKYLPILALIVNAVVLYRLYPDTLLNFSQTLDRTNLVIASIALGSFIVALIYYTVINTSVKLYCKTNDLINQFLSKPILKLDYKNLPQKERILIHAIYKNFVYSFILQLIVVLIVGLGLISSLFYKNASNLYVYAAIAFIAIKIFLPKLPKLIEKLNRKAYLHMD